jgi:hypothetical protein
MVLFNCKSQFVLAWVDSIRFESRFFAFENVLANGFANVHLMSLQVQELVVVWFILILFYK